MSKKLLLEYLEFIKNNFRRKVYLSPENKSFLFEEKQSVASTKTSEKQAKQEFVKKNLSYEELHQLLANGYNLNSHKLNKEASYLFIIPCSIDQPSLFEGKIGEVFSKMITALKLSSYEILVVDETHFDKQELKIYLKNFMDLSKFKYCLIFSPDIFKVLFAHSDFAQYQEKNKGFSFENRKYFSSFNIKNILSFPEEIQQKYKMNLWRGLQNFIAK